MIKNDSKDEGSSSNEGNSLPDVAKRLGARFAERAREHDEAGDFVAENFTDLKTERLFSLGIPLELGGSGSSYSGLCSFLRELAHYCGSTALALSMHQHLVAANVWRYRHNQPGELLLRRIAAEQLILVSTGAGDWLSSNGHAERVNGGYVIRAHKSFASGSEGGNLLMTSAACADPVEGETVLHFPVSLHAAGVTVDTDWNTLGMRGTGSQTVHLDNVFIPEAAVSLRRPANCWHPVFNLVITVAVPLIMSVYLGIAEAAAELARKDARSRRSTQTLLIQLGEMENEITAAEVLVSSMVALTNDYSCEPNNELANRMLIRKTLATKSCKAVGEKALEIVGGKGFYRSFGLERLLRDLQASHFHPLPEKEQQIVTGRTILGLEPVSS